jgi:YD repeat-containing protein
MVARVSVAGRTFEEILPAVPNQVAEFVWDGLDFLGRRINGPVTAKVEVGFVYDAVYYRASRNYERAFAQTGSEPTTVTARQETILWKTNVLAINQFPEAGEVIAAGWTLSPHHQLNPCNLSVLFKGDGSIATNRSRIITTVAGSGAGGYGGDGGPATEAKFSSSSSVAVGPDGSLFIVDTYNYRVRRVDPNGIITTVAGNGERGYSGDGGPATQARIDPTSSGGISVGPDGSLYIADTWNHRIRRVDPQGIITTVAGTGVKGYSGDGGQATKAHLWYPKHALVGPDGSIYIADTGNFRVRRVDLDGIITTVAGNGTRGYSGDGGQATQAQLESIRELAFQSDGSYLILSGYTPFLDHTVRRVSADGIISTVAGTGGWRGYNGDEIPAIEAQLSDCRGIAAGPNGDFYIADWDENLRVRYVDPEGIIHTIAGTGVSGYSGDGGPAIQAQVRPKDVALGPDGSLYIADSVNRRIRKVSTAHVSLNTMTLGEIAFTEANGFAHIFSSGGTHKRTIDLDTDITLYEFGYDEESRLVSITDQFGNQTTINRDRSGVPKSITSPHGITTELAIDEDNRLTRVTYPDGNSYSFAYTAGGLLTSKVEPEGNRFAHEFDPTGRLLTATDEEGGMWQYSRTTVENGGVLTEVLTGEGDLTSYLDFTDSIDGFTSNITEPTGSVTWYGQTGDGLTVNKSLHCGVDLHFEYGLDPEYKFTFVKKVTESTPAGLERNTVRQTAYLDTNLDDVPDRITETVTVNGKGTTLVTDTLKAIRTITSPLVKTVTTQYDPNNLLTTRLSIPGLQDTLYAYDTRGRLTSITSDLRQTTFSYDLQGNLKSITDPENRTTTYSYDAVGRMTQISRPDGSLVGFSYDRNGNMTLLTNPANISHDFAYNKVNLNSSYTTPLSGSYSYVYDRDRRLIRVNFPSGKQVENVYGNGRLEQIQTPEGNIHLTYLCGSKIGSISNGSEAITYSYDGSLVTAENMSGTLNESLSYGYNSDFNLTRFTYEGETVNYTYDDDGLLTGAGNFTIRRNSGNGLPESVTGGALGLSRTFNGYGEVEAQNYTVGGRDLTSWSLTRDKAGRIATRTESIQGVSSNYSYTYDPTGRLLTVTKDETLVEEYQYDSVGTRIYEMNEQRSISGRTVSYDDEDHLLTR